MPSSTQIDGDRRDSAGWRDTILRRVGSLLCFSAGCHCNALPFYAGRWVWDNNSDHLCFFTPFAQGLLYYCIPPPSTSQPSCPVLPMSLCELCGMVRIRPFLLQDAKITHFGDWHECIKGCFSILLIYRHGVFSLCGICLTYNSLSQVALRLTSLL